MLKEYYPGLLNIACETEQFCTVTILKREWIRPILDLDSNNIDTVFNYLCIEWNLNRKIHLVFIIISLTCISVFCSIKRCRLNTKLLLNKVIKLQISLLKTIWKSGIFRAKVCIVQWNVKDNQITSLAVFGDTWEITVGSSALVDYAVPRSV